MSYWRGYTQGPVVNANDTFNDPNDRNQVDSTAFENEPTDKELGVRLVDVSKVKK